jgi:ribosomal protein S18 acetylase RimI-like enzyme
MNIRRATLRDADRLVELWMEMWQFHYKLDPRFAPSPMAATTMRHWIEGHLENPHSAIFCADHDGQIVGYLLATILENMPIVMNPSFGFVSEIAVTEKARRKGVGARLLKEAHAWFKSKLITSVEVNVAVRNAVSRQFWRKMGYAEFIERLQYTIS